MNNPWFIVSTRVVNNQEKIVDQQYLSFDPTGLAKLLDLLDDERDERKVYLVISTLRNPNSALRMVRLREVWHANDTGSPTTESLIYVLDNGRRIVRHRECSNQTLAWQESALLLRV